MHDTGSGRMAGRKLRTKTNAKPVAYADAEPSAFSAMLGGLIEANVDSRADRKKDFDSLEARVGIWVTDIDEGVTLDFRKGSLVVHNGLQAKRDLTIRAEAGTVMNLSNLKIGLLGMPIYYDDVGRSVAMKLVQGKLRIEGLLGNLATLNTVTRIFSVQ
jgi:hypothetical protein